MIKNLSLKHKVALLIILPLCIVMVFAGTFGLRLIRNVLLDQWQETAISKLQKSAHRLDMRLMRPKELLNFFQMSGAQGLTGVEIEQLITQLESFEGVVEVKHNFLQARKRGMGNMHRMQKTTISPLIYNTKIKSQTVSVIAQFTNENVTAESYIEVVLDFSDIIAQIIQASWWQGNKVFVLDRDGSVLASTERGSRTQESQTNDSKKKFGSANPLEIDTWKAIQNKKSGTVFSKERPPEMVSGFYHLQQAPWTLVIMTSGRAVLQPIITFRVYYYLLCAVGILFVAVYLWFMTNKATRAINHISNAANELADGHFSVPLIVEGKDELGDLTKSFNTMSKQLKERLKLRHEMNLAGEVQAALIPRAGFETSGLDVAVYVRYCDKTGGDYVDIIKTSNEKQCATVVVGDVVGHGVGASLLMTTLRALLKCRVSMPGTAADITNDVNALLCQDTIHAANFATLFYLTINRLEKTFEWVRCGHEPALVFCIKSKTFTELKGKGISMGVDQTWKYQRNTMEFLGEEQVVLVGTDGIWDVENLAGDQFGKERTKEIIEQSSHLTAQGIIDAIMFEIDTFCLNQAQNDDITLAIIKTKK